MNVFQKTDYFKAIISQNIQEADRLDPLHFCFFKHLNLALLF